MLRYRKRPIEVDAFLWGSGGSFPDWVITALKKRPLDVGSVFCRNHQWWVATLEGCLVLSDDDWIIRGVRGELYPVRDDIFRATYEQVETYEQVDGAAMSDVRLTGYRLLYTFPAGMRVVSMTTFRGRLLVATRREDGFAQVFELIGDEMLPVELGDGEDEG